MALFIVDITKRHHVTLQSWGNSYLIDAATLTNAASAVSIIQGAEAAFHFDVVDFVRARVATQAANDGIYTTIPLTGTGDQISSGKTMPLFLAMEAVFQTQSPGRPLRKFYHTGFDDPFYDDDFTFDNDLIDDAFVALGQMITDLGDNDTTYVKAVSNAATLVSIEALVKSHQFTKASKRPTP